jgi:hypothetical protein
MHSVFISQFDGLKTDMCGLECSNLCVTDKLMNDLLSMNEIWFECNYLRSIILFDLVLCNKNIFIYTSYLY